jgi:hypothetical protein
MGVSLFVSFRQRVVFLGLVSSLVIGIAGCSVSLNLPDVTTSNLQTTAIGSLQGSTYGGQQPVWNSHVYLMKASTGGSKLASTSLLHAGGNTFADTTVLGTPANPAYYVVTNGYGNFDITGDYSCTYNATKPSQSDQLYLLSLGGNATFAGGGINPNGGATNAYIGMMSTLGQCPSDGTFAGHISFIYMNEVSTVATAYALAGFASNSYSVGSSSTNQIGMANAFANANQLYDITGSAAFHEARQVTPASNTSVAGTVPYRLIDTLANIIATCVNQGATTTPPASGSCATIYGLTGNAPDTASALIYIAQHPNLRGSADVQTLYALQGTTPEFPDKLVSRPNDFAVGVDFQGTTTTNPVDVAIDATGDAWVTNSSGSVLKLTPLGAHAAGSPFTANLGGANYISIDPSGNAWVTAGNQVVEMNNSGGTVAGTPFSNAALSSGLAKIATDSAGTYVANPNAGLNILTLNTPGNIIRITTPGGVPTYNTYYTGLTGILNGAVLNNIPYVTQIANGTSGSLWISGDPSNCVLGLSLVCEGLQVQKIDTSTAFPGSLLLSSPTWTTSNWMTKTSSISYNCFLGLISCAATEKPGFVAVDSSGTGWVSVDAGTANILSGITPIDELASVNSAGTVTNLLTGGGLSTPQGVAVDGAGVVYVANQGGGSLSIYGSSGFLTPSTGLTGAGNGTSPTSVMNTPTTLDIDVSGNIWVVNPSGNAGFITEFIGLATPVIRPLSSGKVGVAP